MKILHKIILISLLVSCSKKIDKIPGIFNQDKTLNAEAIAKESDRLSSSSSGSLSFIQNGSYSPLLLDAEAIQSQWQNLFGTQPWSGASGLTQDDQNFFGARPYDYFLPQERKILGSFGIGVNQQNEFIQFVRKSDVSREYLQTLRNAAGRVCKVAIEREAGNPTNPSNRLIRGRIPTEAQFNQIYTLLLGYANTPGSHAGSSEYAGVFATTFANDAAVIANIPKWKSLYNLVCVAVLTDARIYTR